MDKRIKVYLIGTQNDFYNAAGQGVQRYMYEMANILPKIDTHAFEFTVCKYKKLPFVSNGLTPFMYSLIDNFSRYNIVHNLDARPMAWFRYGKAISITTVHDFHSVTSAELHVEDRKDLRKVLGVHLVLLPGIKSAMRSDYLMANSTQTKEEATELGFDKKRIFVVNFGVDERFLKNRKPARKSNDPFRVGYIGSLSNSKNVGFSIRAFRKTQSKNASFDIWGAKTNQYSRLFEMSRADKRIRFRGFAPENKLVDIYDSFDVFVHPTLYEGFGLPILEAQARGLPVLICKNALIPAEVRKYCIETDDEDHMAEEMERLRLNGYDGKLKRKAEAYARQFTWVRTAEAVINVYNKVYDKEP